PAIRPPAPGCRVSAPLPHGAVLPATTDRAAAAVPDRYAPASPHAAGAWSVAGGCRANVVRPGAGSTAGYPDAAGHPPAAAETGAPDPRLPVPAAADPAPPRASAVPHPSAPDGHCAIVP